jgi:hypothetical protein
MDSQAFPLRSTMTTTWPTDEYQEPPADAIAPPQPAVRVPGEVIASTTETLNLLDEFFRLHASGGTRIELHQFNPRGFTNSEASDGANSRVHRRW